MIVPYRLDLPTPQVPLRSLDPSLIHAARLNAHDLPFPHHDLILIDGPHGGAVGRRTRFQIEVRDHNPAQPVGLREFGQVPPCEGGRQGQPGHRHSPHFQRISSGN